MSIHLCAGFCLKSTRVVGGCESGKMVSMLHVKMHEAETPRLVPRVRTSPAVFQPDFLAVEMRRGKVALLWDLGSGSTRVEYPDFQIDNNKWHRIHATR